MYVVVKKQWGYLPGYSWHDGDSQWWYNHTVGTSDSYEGAKNIYDQIVLNQDVSEKKIILIDKDNPNKVIESEIWRV